jgi:NosR/NirI family nitrous oxide reductase transcriptional regulator
VALSFSDPGYTISWIVMAFFMIPLIFTLFFGRAFCAAGCPLGAIQDLVIIKPISLPIWLRQTLGIIPYIYLGLAILYAATGTDFIICRYDPFIGIFRMDAPFHMVILGVSFLLMGMFIARPYCRFFCPYGVLLNWMSRFSKWHLSITPSECIRCKLCADSCPFDAIETPNDEKTIVHSGKQVQRFILYFLLIPVWILAGGYSVSRSSDVLARVNQDVYLAELLISHPELKDDPENIDIQVFLSSGKSIESQVEDALIIRKKFRIGSWFLGGFLGLIIGVKLMNQFIFRKRTDYEPNRGHCYSCGRCMDYCPVK